VALLLVVGCGGVSPSGAASTRPTGAITYQPGVIQVGGGHATVRSSSSDGLSWTLRGDAPGISDLAVGKIVLVTGEVAGRVLSLKPSGSDVVVTLAPVGLGDVIRDGQLTSNGPQPLTGVENSIAPDFPGFMTDGAGTVLPGATGETSRSKPVLASYLATGAAVPAALDGSGASVEGNGSSFTVLCCDKALGSQFTYDAGGLRIQGSIFLKLRNPMVNYNLTFKDGVLQTGAMSVSGINGVHVEIKAATQSGPEGDIDTNFFLPIQMRIPMGGGAVAAGDDVPPPINLGMFEIVYLYTQFQAKSGAIQATGDYDFATDVHQVSVRDGALDAKGIVFPDAFTAKTKLGDTIAGESDGRVEVAVSAASRICVCFGGLISSDGLFMSIVSEFDVVNVSSALAIIGGKCHGIAYRQSVGVGNGHSISPMVADAINATLKAQGEGPIDARGGQISDPITIWEKWESVPAGIRRCVQ
jgi:hypothetical protein